MGDDVISVGPSGGTSVSLPAPDYAGPAERAMTLGMQLAQRKEQIDSSRADLELKKETLRQHAISGAFDMLPKIANAKGKPKQFLFDVFAKRMELAGIYVDPNVKDMMGSADPEALARLNAAVRANPKLLGDQNFVGYASKVLGSAEEYYNWEKDFASKIYETQAKNDNAQLIATSNAATKESGFATQKLIADQKARAEAVARGVNPQALNDSYIAQHEAGRIAQQKQQAVDSQVDLRGAQADAATANADSRTAKTPSEIQKNVSQAGMYDRLPQDKSTLSSYQEDRLAQGDKRIYTQNFQQTQKSLQPIKQQTQRLDKAITLVDKPSVTYGELREALIDFAGSVANSGNVIPQARERGLTQTFTTLSDQAKQLANRYLLNNPAGLAVNKDTVSALRADLDRINLKVREQFQNVAQTEIEGRRGNGFNDKQADRLYKLYGFTPPAPGNPAPVTPQPNAAAAPAPAVAKPTFTPAQIQAMVGSGGAPKTKAYLKSKGYNDQEISALGVQ